MTAVPARESFADDDRDVLRPETVLNGYTIERKLGQGGFGIVYLASHNELGSVVAIKEYLPIELAVRDGHSVRPRQSEFQEVFNDGLRRFLDEARRVIEFRHDPNIVSCTDFFRGNGTAYLVMEYEDATPLSELIRAREANAVPFTEDELRALMEPLLSALSRVHSAGVLHRDIKPSNILVRHADEQPVLIDFGAAKHVVSEHTKSTAPYTDGYAALEQVGNGKLGSWTDMYALGAVMWRMVATSNPPWKPPEPVKVESRASARVHDHDDPLPSAQELGAGRFSSSLLRAIDRCLRLKESDRIQTSDALLEVFRKPRVVERTESGRPSPPLSDGLLTAADDAPVLYELPPTDLKLGWIGWAGAAIVAIAMVTCLTRDQAVEASPFTISPVPSTATIEFVDGNHEYEPGMALTPGRYEVRVTAPGYLDWSEVIPHGASATNFPAWLRRRPAPAPNRPEPPSGSRRRVREEVPQRSANDSEPRTSSFHLELHPLEARVKFAGRTEEFRQGMDLPLGSYEIEVSAPGFTTRRVRITHVGPGPHRIELDPQVPPSAEARIGEGTEPDQGTEVESGSGVGGVFRVDEGVSSPLLLHKVEPEYSEEALQAKLEGTVMLAVEVWEDGTPRNIRVLRSLGLGLDEKAIEAVTEWRFWPGEKNGKPVRVAAQIQVSFRLLDRPSDSGPPTLR